MPATIQEQCCQAITFAFHCQILASLSVLRQLHIVYSVQTDSQTYGVAATDARSGVENWIPTHGRSYLPFFLFFSFDPPVMIDSTRFISSNRLLTGCDISTPIELQNRNRIKARNKPLSRFCSPPPWFSRSSCLSGAVDDITHHH